MVGAEMYGASCKTGIFAMLNTTLLMGFVATSLVVLLIPGPGVTYVVARAVGQGWLAGIITALGQAIGVLVHVAAAVAGLSALLLASATAFGLVKFVGAVYLIYLGLQVILSRPAALKQSPVNALPFFRLFVDGVVVSIFNPKIAVFFLAFLPQFTDPAVGPIPLQIFLLGSIYAALALLTDGGYATLAAGVKSWLGNRAMRSPLPRYLSGSLLIGLGVKTAFSSQQQ